MGCPLYNGQNLDYTGSASTNPYKLIQQGGKKTRSNRRANVGKRKNINKRNKSKRVKKLRSKKHY
jgi:hypothetical protein